MVAPLLAVGHEECAEAFRDAFAAHDEAWAGGVDVAPLVEEVASGFVVAEHDDGVEADTEAEDGAVLLGPLCIRPPRVFLRQLGDISDQWQTRRAGREAFVSLAVMVVDS